MNTLSTIANNFKEQIVENFGDIPSDFEKANGDKEDEKGYVMRITKCPHENRKHYAKNMCSSCYRKFGRNEYAVNCPHTNKLLYSKGMCQTCYLSDYHQTRTKARRARK